ncbi:amidohydrolase [uncultured Algimonas sp.]|uniref:amidohydrolase n=1 Tax=uncultured Algimonas sp. TaxID=1547920 RepID=UPI002631319E|nr:amidohydrolase [uncultured Algimonas sp.]
MMRSLVLTAVLSVAATPALAQSLFLDDANFVLDSGETQIVDIRITDGRIADMQADLQVPSGVTTISGAWVSPGLFAPYSTLGIVDIGGESSTNDTQAETELFSAAIRAADSFNPREVHIANARRRGVTHAAVVPQPDGDVIFGGIGMIAKLDNEDDSILSETAFMHVALGEAGASRAGGSRGAAIQQLRSALDDARRSYLQHVEGDVFQRRDARAFRAVLSGDMPLMISASRASDLLRIIRIKEDVPALDIIVVGAEEAHLVADALAENDIKVIVDPLENLPDSFDSLNASLDNILVLEDAGVEYAISGLSSRSVVKAGALAQHAGNAVGQGLPYDAAMRAVTTVPAGWFGIDLGRRAVGEAATMVVWDGDPLEVTSAPTAIFIDGEAVPMVSRMTALRDRYNPANADDRPHKYR